MPGFIDLSGQVYGRWIVISRAEWPTPIGGARWLCRCECGKEGVVRASILRRGESRSCGCLNVDVHRAHARTLNRTHGLSKTKTYDTWVNIISRCTNPLDSGYHKYGARGVTICQRWRDSFKAFYADMGEKPKGLTIDRIDNGRGYEPGNCRWVTQREQQNNRTNNNRLVHDGRSLTMMEWSRETGMDRTTIRGRIKMGRSVADALTKPVDPEGGRFK